MTTKRSTQNIFFLLCFTLVNLVSVLLNLVRGTQEGVRFMKGVFLTTLPFHKATPVCNISHNLYIRSLIKFANVKSLSDTFLVKYLKLLSVLKTQKKKSQRKHNGKCLGPEMPVSVASVQLTAHFRSEPTLCSLTDGWVTLAGWWSYHHPKQALLKGPVWILHHFLPVVLVNLFTLPAAEASVWSLVVPYPCS